MKKQVERTLFAAAAGGAFVSAAVATTDTGWTGPLSTLYMARTAVTAGLVGGGLLVTRNRVGRLALVAVVLWWCSALRAGILVWLPHARGDLIPVWGFPVVAIVTFTDILLLWPVAAVWACKMLPHFAFESWRGAGPFGSRWFGVLLVCLCLGSALVHMVLAHYSRPPWLFLPVVSIQVSTWLCVGVAFLRLATMDSSTPA